VPRLRQRVVEDPLGVAPPQWMADPHFDLSYHVCSLRLPEPGSLRALYDLVAPIASDPFDRERPLWKLYCVDGLEGGRSSMIVKVNHALADGQGLLWIMHSFVEPTPGDEPQTSTLPIRATGLTFRAPPPAEVPTAGTLDEILRLGEAVRHRLGGAYEQARRAADALGRSVPEVVAHPLATAGEVVGTLGSIARVLWPAFEPMSPVWRGRSLNARFDDLEVPLDALKRASRNAGGTLNDGFLAAAAGGCARYHRAHRSPVAKLRLGMPVNLRAGTAETIGNRFVPLRFPIPVNTRDPQRRQQIVSAAARASRSEAGLAWADDVAGAMTMLGEAGVVRLVGGMMKAVDFIASNIVGPPFPVYAGGARVERMVGFGPLGGAAVNLTLVSYDGVARIGIRTDSAAVPDPERLLAHLRTGFNEVLAARELTSPAKALTPPTHLRLSRRADSDSGARTVKLGIRRTADPRG
jgi:diacylglycerol O-acyltransferase / wax synthase